MANAAAHTNPLLNPIAMRHSSRQICLHIPLIASEDPAVRPPHIPPALARLITLGDALPADAIYAIDPSSALCALFDPALASAPPVAALEVLGGEYSTADPDRYYLRMDPVHLRPRRDDLVLWPIDDLDTQESTQLREALNRFLAADGLMLQASAPARWYAALRNTPRLRTHAVSSVSGQPIGPYLPSGEDAPVWLARLTELQMLLHSLPNHEQRESLGKMPVNALWPWGGGRLPVIATRSFDQVCTDELLCRGLARCAGSQVHAMVQGFDAVPDASRVLVGFSPQADLADLESNWFAPLWAALRARRIERVDIILAGAAPRAVSVRPGHRWRFWRRLPAN